MRPTVGVERCVEARDVLVFACGFVCLRGRFLAPFYPFLCLSELERKLSVRSQRQELVQRGLLQPEGRASGLRTPFVGQPLVLTTRFLSHCVWVVFYVLGLQEEPIDEQTKRVAGRVRSKQAPPPPAKPARSRATTELLTRSGAGADKQKAGSDGDLRSTVDGSPTERGVQFGEVTQIGRGGADRFTRPQGNTARRTSGNVISVAERRNGSDRTARRAFPTPPLPSSPKKLALKVHVATLTDRPQDVTAPPEVESVESPGDEESVDATDEDEDDEDVPQSGDSS